MKMSTLVPLPAISVTGSAALTADHLLALPVVLYCSWPSSLPSSLFNPCGQGKMDQGKRKVVSTKQQVKRGRGQASYVPSNRNLEENIAEEERIQRMGRTIVVRPDSPLRIAEFDSSYMRENTDVFNLHPPQDTDNHKVLDYATSWKKAEEAREVDPYASGRSHGIDYIFWNAFQSNFYATDILTKPSGKIGKMQCIDFGDLHY